LKISLFEVSLEVSLLKSTLPVFKAIFPIDCQGINVGKQPALGLGQMQIDGSRLAARRQKLADLFHMGPRLVFLRKLLQRDQGRRQCFRDHPLVVAGNSLSWHSDHPFVLQPAIRAAPTNRSEPTQRVDR